MMASRSVRRSLHFLRLISSQQLLQCTVQKQHVARFSIFCEFRMQAMQSNLLSPFKAERMVRLRGSLWKSRKGLSREAQLVVRQLTSNRWDNEALSGIIKTSAARLLKIDIMAVLREVQRQKLPHIGRMIFDLIRREAWYKPDIFLYSDLMAVFAKKGDLKAVEQLFELLEEDGLEPELNTYTELLRAIIWSKNVERIDGLLEEMKEAGCPPDLLVYRLLWIGLCKINRKDIAERYKEDLIIKQNASYQAIDQDAAKEADEYEI